ncbi:NADH-quinone oxidoreductase subunit NuoE [Candidatus Aerophobetes bacterium]|uniref:NADH-quinone oxidoreductase subunit NuoE n=1 Tax=Aerophobetes bacterium TaxID=2030807 RepID=A0A523QHH6_UNCAE|nr:MAG: NADH-quinone oxidoreductase subunit NuoE [Candidatus Aerophobetes bacterium]
MDPAIVDEILDRYKRKKSALIATLQDIQAEYNYLPKEALLHMRESLNIPLTQIYGIASFYKSFSLKPRGRHIINVCLGTACHVRGGQKILESLERYLGIKIGQTTSDLNFTLEAVRCLGCCGLAPVVTIGDDLHGKMNQVKIQKAIEKYKG